MFTFTFWAAAIERAAKTAAQAAIAFWATGSVTGLFGIDWAATASVAGFAAVLSVFTSIASGGRDGNPSAGNLETTGRRAAR
ncbi:MAG: hypothetical protein IIZ13_08320 [Renibacterium sp.]|nr:hypothetical protein [Renibacterium sp.]